MAEEQSQQQVPVYAPGWWRELAEAADTLIPRVGALAKAGVNWTVALAAAVGLTANRGGRGTLRRIGRIFGLYAGEATDWTRDEVADVIAEGRRFVLANWFIVPFVNIVITMFPASTWTSTVYWTFFLWLGMGAWALYFWVRRLPLIFAAGVAKASVSTSWKVSPLSAFISSVQLFLNAGTDRGIKFAQDFSSKFWGVFYWWVVFGFYMCSAPLHTIPSPFLFIGTFPAILLSLAENASKHGFKNIRGEPILNKDGQQAMPRAHRVLNQISIITVVGLWVLSWALWLPTEQQKDKKDGGEHVSVTQVSDVLTRPLIDGRHTPIGVAPREPWYTLKRLTETELNVLVFHAAIIGMLLLAMLFAASQPWRGYAAPFLLIIPALYYREWVAFGVILLALLIVYSTVKPRAALAPA